MTRITLMTVFIILFISSCKQELQYKHQENPDVLPCKFEDDKLVKEALYEFEDYIITNYPYRDLHSLYNGYTNYWHVASSNFPLKTDSLSNHAKTILNTLLKKNILQKKTNGNITLNQKAGVVLCIAKNIDDPGLNTTFNALLETNSLRPDLFVPAIKRRSDIFIKDKALATYAALELFYGKLANTDLTLTDKERFDAFRATQTQINHDGHNH